MRQLTMILLCGLFAMAVPIRARRIVKNPDALGCLNVTGGELRVREVMFADTATTVLFTIDYPAGHNFRISDTCYLLDEKDRRYPLRSAEGLSVNTWVISPDSATTNFTLHFEPLPRRTRVFDFIEYDGQGAFMVLGIHDRRHKLRLPTMDELARANAYAVPADWFTTDSVTLCGRIEDYTARADMPTAFEGYCNNAFSKENMAMVVDIQPDGTFVKRWKVDYPMWQAFRLDKALPGMAWLNIYVRPGDTINVTLSRGDDGQYRCIYHDGSCQEVKRWLSSGLLFSGIASRMSDFKGTPGEAGALAEKLWRLILYRLTVAARNGFTPMEMQLAMADAQVRYATAVMDYVLSKEFQQNDDPTDADRLERDTLCGTEFYSHLLGRVDFDNPMLMVSDFFDVLLNRMQYAWPVTHAIAKQAERMVGDDEKEFDESEKAEIDTRYAKLQAMMGEQESTLMAQLCNYQNMMGTYNLWRSAGNGTVLPYCMETFAHEAVRRHAEAYHAYRQSHTEPATPLPEGQPAELIRSLLARYPGRYLLIDFWGMGCGPCRGDIQASKELRAEIAKRNDVKLVFIAGEATAEGSEAYHKYVKEWLADEETVCIPHKEFSRLQEYFRFNGIPHYETITPDGRRVNESYRFNGLHNFEFDMERLLKAFD